MGEIAAWVLADVTVTLPRLLCWVYGLVLCATLLLGAVETFLRMVVRFLEWVEARRG